MEGNSEGDAVTWQERATAQCDDTGTPPLRAPLRTTKTQTSYREPKNCNSKVKKPPTERHSVKFPEQGASELPRESRREGPETLLTPSKLTKFWSSGILDGTLVKRGLGAGEGNLNKASVSSNGHISVRRYAANEPHSPRNWCKWRSGVRDRRLPPWFWNSSVSLKQF